MASTRANPSIQLTKRDRNKTKPILKSYDKITQKNMSDAYVTFRAALKNAHRQLDKIASDITAISKLKINLHEKILGFNFDLEDCLPSIDSSSEEAMTNSYNTLAANYTELTIAHQAIEEKLEKFKEATPFEHVSEAISTLSNTLTQHTDVFDTQIISKLKKLQFNTEERANQLNDMREFIFHDIEDMLETSKKHFLAFAEQTRSKFPNAPLVSLIETTLNTSDRHAYTAPHARQFKPATMGAKLRTFTQEKWHRCSVQ